MLCSPSFLSNSRSSDFVYLIIATTIQLVIESRHGTTIFDTVLFLPPHIQPILYSFDFTT